MKKISKKIKSFLEFIGIIVIEDSSCRSPQGKLYASSTLLKCADNL